MDLTKSNTIKGIIYSAYDTFGPTPIYTFPLPIEEQKDLEKNDDFLKLTQRDFTQISIKNLSLFSTEYKEDKNQTYFGIIPHPDFKLTSVVYSTHVNIQRKEKPVQTALCILVDENRRNFLYNNHERIRAIIVRFFDNFSGAIAAGYKSSKEVEEFFDSLFDALLEMERRPSTPITSQRKMKILFSGLDNSGKTSFLLSVDRKFSKILGVKPTMGANIQSINALGSTIFLWDLGGQISFREKYLSKFQIYLFETDLLFYFIDIKDENRFQESFEYLAQIYSILHNQLDQKTSIIFILSKADIDILEDKSIKENTENIIKKLKEITNNPNPEVFLTSIFDVTTILRAFSSGISKLSPNRDIINLNITKFSRKLGIDIMLLLSNEGLLLADYYSDRPFPSTIKENNLFEITAPQFTILFKILSKFKALKENEAVFKIANSNIYIKKFKLENIGVFFLLFGINDLKKKKIISEELPEFIKKTKDLLIGYI